MVIVRGEAAGFPQDVVVNQQHRLTADEPEAAGGTDTGPSPYDYLLVALGT
jgi:putative redox protein